MYSLFSLANRRKKKTPQTATQKFLARVGKILLGTDPNDSRHGGSNPNSPRAPSNASPRSNVKKVNSSFDSSLMANDVAVSSAGNPSQSPKKVVPMNDLKDNGNERIAEKV